MSEDTKTVNSDDRLVVRINSDEFAKFKMKSVAMGKEYTTMIREIVLAFNEDRLRVIPNETQTEGLKLYMENK